ncbi:MAG TPA: AAA family ATPase [Geobacter sp.]|nr:AAA family ATPase [Geobacter sp.]
MYWESFGFKEPPFALTPNPAFLFLSSPHQEAFAHLLFAIENRAGFIELSGEVGTGKTTIVRTLLNQLDPATYSTALIFNPTLSPLGFLKEVNSEFGLNCDGSDMRDLHTALNAYLLEENLAGRTVVLVIDEAQNLSVEVLEHIRLISNLETDSDKLIQIVLVGQPELNALLARTELRQLDQRITVRYHLKPMCFDDTCAYIRHRIRFAAEGREPLTFSNGALKRIYKFSGGLPRLINGVCDRTLLLAYTRECKEVSPAMADLCIADLRKESPRNRRAVPLKAPMAALFLCVLVVAGFSLLSQSLLPQEKEEPAVQAAPALARDAALRGIASVSEQDNLYAAVNAVLSAWQVQSVQPAPGQAATLRTLVRQRGLMTTKVNGNLDALARLNAPALLHVTVPGVGERLVALVGLNQDEVSVAPSIAGRGKLTRAELAQFWSGGATLIWKDFHSLSSRAKPADKAAGAKLLQGLLKQVGFYNGPINGNLGKMTQASLADFQRREQLPVDGQASGQTLMMLYRRAGGFFPPGLDRSGAGNNSAGSQGVGRN